MELGVIGKGDALSKQQFDTIMQEITKHHRFGGWNEDRSKVDRYIKYVRPHWDMRDLKCFYVDFDNIRFDFRQSDESMFDRIMKWLNGSDNVAYERIKRP
jgi:hypothetical protein